MNVRTDIRPTVFTDLVGPSKDLVALKAKCERDGVPHTVLFHGPTGCGKTTTARILANLLEEDGAVDFQDINASDLNGVDAARALAQLGTIRPLTGARVIILDECHRLSKEAQDVLLKPTEEPPAWCYWFFCTTEPTKLSKTLAGRCFKVQVNELATKDAVKVLVTKALKFLKAKPEVADALAVEIFHKGIANPRGVLEAVEAFTLGGKIAANEGGGVLAFDAVRAYFQGNRPTVLAYFKEATGADIVSWQFIAANYGASVLKGKPDLKTAALVLNITEGYPEEAVLRAAWLTARVCVGPK